MQCFQTLRKTSLSMDQLSNMKSLLPQRKFYLLALAVEPNATWDFCPAKWRRPQAKVLPKMKGEQETELEMIFPSTKKTVTSHMNKLWITDSTVKFLERRMTEFIISFIHIWYHIQCSLMVQCSVTVFLWLKDLWWIIFPGDLSAQFCRW